MSYRIKSPALYDLHLHTCWSYDATAEPEPYFQRARELGVRCIAIAEHHNIDSADETRAIAERYPEIRLIPAAELTVTTSIGAVDLLCYNLPRIPTPELAQVLKTYHEWQRATGSAYTRGMQMLGYDYTDADRLELLRSYRPARVLEYQGATHVKGGIQKEFFRARGFFTDQEDYVKLYERTATVFPRPPYPAVETVAPAVKAAGGLMVIAHPKRYFLDNDPARMDVLRAECALDGIECAHRAVPPELSAFYREYCLKHGLISTGGSDCHEHDDIVVPPEAWGYTEQRKFACHIGSINWLDEFLERCDG